MIVLFLFLVGFAAYAEVWRRTLPYERIILVYGSRLIEVTARSWFRLKVSVR